MNEINASIAIVILTWNSERYIDNCLKAVASLNFAQKYVYIVDNGSQDKTQSVIKKYENSSTDFTSVLLKENVGTTRSRNIALKLLPPGVDYVCILDSDTVVNCQAFESMVRHLRDDAQIGLIGPKMVNDDGVQQFSGRNLPTVLIKLLKAAPLPLLREYGADLEIPVTEVQNHVQEVGYLLSACWMMPYSTLQRVGLLDEKIFYAPEDVDYCVRVHQKGLKVVYCDDASIVHAYQRISHKKLFSKINVEHLKGLMYYFLKYKYFINSKKAWDYND